MRKHIAFVVMVMLVFAGGSSSAVITGAFAKSKPLSARQHEMRLGPKPTPQWYWRWQVWRLGEGYAKNKPHERSLRPHKAPHRIPNWAWRRFHFFLLARAGGRTGTGTGSRTTVGGRYVQAISYSRRPLPFRAVRVVDVGSASALRSAVAGLRAGDLVRAIRSFTVTSASKGAALVISKRLSSPAVIDLSGHSVRFVYSGGRQFPAVWLNNAANVRIY